MKFKYSILSLALASVLTGCGLEGDDGEVGAQGPTGQQGSQGEQGPQGEQGQPGKHAPTSLATQLIGRVVLNSESPEGAAEIVAFQKSTGWVYAVNSSGAQATVEVIDINNMDADALTADSEGVINNANLTPSITIALTANTNGDANSIAIDNNNQLLAVAMAAPTKTDNGQVAFYDISGAQPVFIKNVTVGALPDGVTFTPDGSKLIVANEGEPNGDYSIDPEGTISIIAIVDGVPSDTATSVGFTAYNDKKSELEAQGMIFANPTGRTINGNVINTSVAMDIEPEYVAVSEDSRFAYVTLQEVNGLAVVDLSDNSLTVRGLGLKDWSALRFDASDKDSGVNFKHYPGLYGLYQPDTTASYQWNGANFIVTANEGDGREYFFTATDEADCLAKGGLDYDSDDGCLAFIDETRVEDLDLAANFDYVNNDDDDIGRLIVTTFKGAQDASTDGSGTYEALYTYGARSFTIWDSNGLVVFDSGDDVDVITAGIHGSAFNNNEDENSGDTRSDAKGAEPEALAIGKIDGRTYAFIGLERMGGIMAYDITNPYQPFFVDYFINRGLVEDADITGDLAPEGMKFIAAEDSPTGEALLVIGNEISGSVAIWQISAE